MRMVIVMSVWGWATARQCRQSGSTLYCTGAMDEHQGSDIETVVVREWDREWCGETGLRSCPYMPVGLAVKRIWVSADACPSR